MLRKHPMGQTKIDKVRAAFGAIPAAKIEDAYVVLSAGEVCEITGLPRPIVVSYLCAEANAGRLGRRGNGRSALYWLRNKFVRKKRPWKN